MFFAILPSGEGPESANGDLARMSGAVPEWRVAEILSHNKQTIQDITEIVQNLLILKERLLIQFGQESRQFVAKTVDTMVVHARRTVEELEAISQNPALDASVLEKSAQKAIEVVEKYRPCMDEQKLQEKIVRETIENTCHAIEKDQHVLENYEKYFLQQEVFLLPEKHEIEHRLTEKLSVIFHELAKLQTQKYSGKSLKELFCWRSQVDVKRGALVELGLLTIDSILHHPTHVVAFEAILEMNEESDMWVKVVDDIVDRAHNLVRAAESVSDCDIALVNEVDGLVNTLTGEMNQVVPQLSEEFQTAFDDIQLVLQQLQEKLKKRKKSNH